MNTALTILLAVAMLTVLVVLFTGIGVFAAGSEEANDHWSVKLMSLRVAAQAFVLLVLVLLFAERVGYLPR
jgi:hypothetical protein